MTTKENDAFLIQKKPQRGPDKKEARIHMLKWTNDSLFLCQTL